MNAYTAADVAALTSVTCRAHHGLGAPEQPCFGCRSDAARLLDAVASGIAARALRDTAAAIGRAKPSSTFAAGWMAAEMAILARADLLERAS